jgi:hypothetical protein
MVKSSPDASRAWASVIDDGAAITVERLIGPMRWECLDHVVMFARIRACGADTVEHYADNARGE